MVIAQIELRDPNLTSATTLLGECSMMRKVAGTALMIACFIIVSCKADDDQTTLSKLETPAEKFSYAMGMDVANALKKLESEIDLPAFLKGATDGFKDNDALLTPEEILQVKKEIAAREKEKRKIKQEALARKNLKNGEAFLAEKRKDKDVTATDSGLLYQVVKKGTGKTPGLEDRVRIHYRIAGIDGTAFDDSVMRGTPAVVAVKGVIPGLSEALQLMPVGSKYTLFIPPQQAYGAKSAGPGGKIQPNSALVFEVELLGIEQPDAPS